MVTGSCPKVQANCFSMGSASSFISAQDDDGIIQVDGFDMAASRARHLCTLQGAPDLLVDC